MIINEIRLFTSNIQKQKHFYQNVLGFALLFNSDERISFKVGGSVLSFQYKKEIKPSHVAFNIYSNKIHEALDWLQNRVTVLPDGDNLISDFKSWNAKAIYFYDADHNIMEFISRKGLALDSEEPFSANSIVSIGEMGIVTTHIEVIYDALNKMRPIPIFSGDFSRFCALGNDEGLFIVIDKNEKGWHPTQEEAFESDFIINGDYNFHFENGKIKELL